MIDGSTSLGMKDKQSGPKCHCFRIFRQRNRRELFFFFFPFSISRRALSREETDGGLILYLMMGPFLGQWWASAQPEGGLTSLGRGGQAGHLSLHSQFPNRVELPGENASWEAGSPRRGAWDTSRRRSAAGRPPAEASRKTLLC